MMLTFMIGLLCLEYACFVIDCVELGVACRFGAYNTFLVSKYIAFPLSYVAPEYVVSSQVGFIQRR